MNHDDLELKNLFDRIKEESSGIPDFEQVWQNAVEKRKKKRTIRFYKISFVSGILLFIGSYLFYNNKNPERVLQTDITLWKSPTEDLLLMGLNQGFENKQQQLSTWQPPSSPLLEINKIFKEDEK